MMDNFLWKASEDKINQSNIFKFCQYLDKKIFSLLPKIMPNFGNGRLDLWMFFGQLFGIFQIYKEPKGRKFTTKILFFMRVVSFQMLS